MENSLGIVAKYGQRSFFSMYVTAKGDRYIQQVHVDGSRDRVETRWKNVGPSCGGVRCGNLVVGRGREAKKCG